MTDPSRDEVERGSTALFPFVQAWHLSLNPEGLDLMVWAVLRAVRSSGSFDEVLEDSRTLIAEHAESHARLLAAMTKHVAEFEAMARQLVVEGASPDAIAISLLASRVTPLAVLDQLREAAGLQLSEAKEVVLRNLPPEEPATSKQLLEYAVSRMEEEAASQREDPS